jgi:hypothetical protein
VDLLEEKRERQITRRRTKCKKTHLKVTGLTGKGASVSLLPDEVRVLLANNEPEKV